jgi:predicted transposase YdaD
VFTKNHDLEWLRKRKAMLNDFLANSPIYQDVIAEALTKGETRGRAEGEARGEARGRTEGEARGRAEGEVLGKLQAATASRQRLATTLLSLVATRFPALNALAQQCAEEPKNDHEILLQLVLAIGLTQTEQDAQYLLEINSNPGEGRRPTTTSPAAG